MKVYDEEETTEDKMIEKQEDIPGEQNGRSKYRYVSLKQTIATSEL